MDSDYAYLRQESLELATQVESLLLDKEQIGFEENDITVLFRYVHTLKGGCGSFGFAQCTATIHAAEFILDNIRNGRSSMSSNTVELLLDLTDCIRDTFSVDYNEGEYTECNLDSLKALEEKLKGYMQHNNQPQSTTMDNAEEFDETIVDEASCKETLIPIETNEYEQRLIRRGILDKKESSVAAHEGNRGIDALITSTVGFFKKSLLEQLNDAQSVKFDFSRIKRCDRNGIQFLRAIPQVVKSKKSRLIITGVSQDVYKEAMEYGIHLKEILTPYVLTSCEIEEEERVETQFAGELILATVDSSELDVEVISTLFKHLEGFGQLEVEFDIDSISLLSDSYGDYVLQWKFLLRTNNPRSDIEALLRDLPSDMFWELNKKSTTASATPNNTVSEILKEWGETYHSLLGLLEGQSAVDTKEIIRRLKDQGEALKKLNVSPEDVSVGSLLDLFKAVLE